MRSIDINAHLTQRRSWLATERAGDCHSTRREQDARGGPLLPKAS